jgi:hypothetical protein
VSDPSNDPHDLPPSLPPSPFSGSAAHHELLRGRHQLPLVRMHVCVCFVLRIRSVDTRVEAVVEALVEVCFTEDTPTTTGPMPWKSRSSSRNISRSLLNWKSRSSSSIRGRGRGSVPTRPNCHWTDMYVGAPPAHTSLSLSLSLSLSPPLSLLLAPSSHSTTAPTRL